MYRQGDVLIVRASGLKGLKPAKEAVLAFGEATGHAHRLLPKEGGDLLIKEREDGTTEEFKLSKGGILIHDEHDPVEMLADEYISIRQREYTPEEPRRVVD